MPTRTTLVLLLIGLFAHSAQPLDTATTAGADQTRTTVLAPATDAPFTFGAHVPGPSSDSQPQNSFRYDGPDLKVRATHPLQSVNVSWAMGRFDAAGLDLPPLEISFARGPDVCDGHRGTAATDRLPVKLEVCVDSYDEVQQREVLLHELAHAWDLGGLATSPESRDNFLWARGLANWHDQSEEWAHRGAEQAAEILMWGLRDSQTPIATSAGSVGPQDTASLTQAFRMLTGRLPLWVEAGSAPEAVEVL